MTPQEYCQNKAAASGSSFYYSFLFLTPPQKQAIMAVYAYCREIDDIVDECKNPEVAQNKLIWWRQELKDCFAGQGSHPVSLALQDPIKSYNLPMEYFLELIDGVETDLGEVRFQSYTDLSLYCYRVAGVIGLLAAEIFGFSNRNTLKYAQKLGTAFQLTNILRDVSEDLERGRLYIPLEDLDKFEVSLDDLAERKTTDNIRQLMQFQAKRANNFYQEAFNLLPDEDRYPQRSGIIMAEIYKTILLEIEKDGYRVLEKRFRLTPIRKLWIAWKTARHEKKMHKQIH